jgi:hypothetical protein
MWRLSLYACYVLDFIRGMLAAPERDQPGRGSRQEQLSLPIGKLQMLTPGP